MLYVKKHFVKNLWNISVLIFSIISPIQRLHALYSHFYLKTSPTPFYVWYKTHFIDQKGSKFNVFQIFCLLNFKPHLISNGSIFNHTKVPSIYHLNHIKWCIFEIYSFITSLKLVNMIRLWNDWQKYPFFSMCDTQSDFIRIIMLYSSHLDDC